MRQYSRLQVQYKIEIATEIRQKSQREIAISIRMRIDSFHGGEHTVDSATFL